MKKFILSGLVVVLTSVLAFWHPTPLSAAGCDPEINGSVLEGALSVTVQGQSGATVTVEDFDSEQVLGTAVLAGAAGCNGSAEITLSQATSADQILFIYDDNSSSLKWVQPNLDPWIAIIPYCGADGSVDTTVYGNYWGNDPVSITWGGQSVATAIPDDGGISAHVVLSGQSDDTYEVVASDGTSTATTLYQIPCASSGTIAGTIYVDTPSAWLLVEDIDVTLTIPGTQYALNAQTDLDGGYYFDTEYDGDYAIYACVELNGKAYASTDEGIAPSSSDVDLYLENTGQAVCPNDDFTPTEPPELQIGTPQLSLVNDKWRVTVEVSNTSSIDIDQPFFVDAWLPDANGFGYIDMQDGLAANSSETVVIALRTRYPLQNGERVAVMVDSAYEIDELNDNNNTRETTISSSQTVGSVSVYVLAFDNPSYSAGNLTPQLPETIKGIVAATEADDNKLAVVLADLDQDGDTHIMTVFNGEVTHIEGLPDSEGVIDDSISEYDMSSGETLGGFLLWANLEFPANQTNLFVYAHGAPLAPETDISALIGSETRSRTPVPLPSWVFAHPDMTDMHPVGLLTPHDLDVALEKGTTAGMVYDVVDLVHCFSLSIEEVYEIAPHADVVTGSPNYAYFDAALPGAALAAIDASMDAETLADTILQTYDSLLPDEGYPRIMVAVDTVNISMVKALWDEVSAELIIAFNQNETQTRNRLLAAYQNSAKYDTNYCEPDWALSAPDALSDMHDFARQLSAEFGANSLVGLWADDTADELEAAVLSRYVTNGVPHFTTIENAPEWEFTGLGVSLYTDFAGVDKGSSTELSWHADFYNDNVTTENPFPFYFIAGNNSTWADVFARYWEGTTISTNGCVRTFPSVRDAGELTIAELVNPRVAEVAQNAPILPSISLDVEGEIGNVIVEFSIEQSGTVVYSDTIGTGRLFSGTHWLKARQSWTPSATGAYSLTVRVDPQNFVDEAIESGNVLVFEDVVSAENGTAIEPTADITDGQQWVTDLNAPLSTNSSARADLELEVTAYQFTQSAAPVQSASAKTTSKHSVSGSELNLPLSTDTQPGNVLLHVWDVSDGTRTQLPTALQVNYIPANTPIAEDATICYPFSAEVGDNIQLSLNVPTGDDANMFIWYPHSFDAPDLIGTRVGDDQMRIDSAPVAGDYLLCVMGVSAGGTTFTLSVVENGSTQFTHPTSAENSATAVVPTVRPLYEAPVPRIVSAPTAITSLDSSVNDTLPLPLMALLMLILPTVAMCRRKS